MLWLVLQLKGTPLIIYSCGKQLSMKWWKIKPRFVYENTELANLCHSYNPLELFAYIIMSKFCNSNIVHDVLGGIGNNIHNKKIYMKSSSGISHICAVWLSVHIFNAVIISSSGIAFTIANHIPFLKDNIYYLLLSVSRSVGLCYVIVTFFSGYFQLYFNFSFCFKTHVHVPCFKD